MRIKQAELARRLGVGPAHINRAVKSGRLRLGDDGKLDEDEAIAALAETRQREPRSAAATAHEPPAPRTLIEARTANEVLKATERNIKVKRLKGELLPKADVVRIVHDLARRERDAWVNWPARIASLMAAEVGCDAHVLRSALDKAVSEHLAELSEVQYP